MFLQCRCKSGLVFALLNCRVARICTALQKGNKSTPFYAALHFCSMLWISQMLARALRMEQ